MTENIINIAVVVAGIDEEYQNNIICGINKYTRESKINALDRICQFEVVPSQKATFWQKLKWFFSNGIKLVEVDSLNNEARGGFGSSGVK